MTNNANHHCRVCGYFSVSPPWGEDGQSPTYELCACCGVEFGYEDCTVGSTKRFREQWLKAGTPWQDPKSMPTDWSFDSQIDAIPTRFR